MTGAAIIYSLFAFQINYLHLTCLLHSTLEAKQIAGPVLRSNLTPLSVLYSLLTKVYDEVRSRCTKITTYRFVRRVVYWAT